MKFRTDEEGPQNFELSSRMVQSNHVSFLYLPLRVRGIDGTFSELVVNV